MIWVKTEWRHIQEEHAYREEHIKPKTNTEKMRIITAAAVYIQRNPCSKSGVGFTAILLYVPSLGHGPS